MIKGETVILIEQEQKGFDAFNAPIYEETQIPVSNVIVGQPNTDEVINDMSLYGKRLLFTLGIPKGDSHDWTNKPVIIRGQRFLTYGFPLTQTEANVPTIWNTQVKVAMYG